LEDAPLKYSFMTFSTTELTLAQDLDVARRYGYDGIELRIDANHKHGVEVATGPGERAAIRKAFADAGIAAACVATSLTYADPQKTTAMLEQTHERIELTADIGAPTMRVFGGNLPDGVTREQAYERVALSLSEVASHAKERGVTLAFETHDAWTDPRDVAEVLRRVAHPNIACNWDILHPVRTKKASLEESFSILEPWIRHLHIHDGSGDGIKSVPIGTGIIDHRTVLKCLKSIAFTGFLSGEWINWEPYETHLPREIGTLRKYELEFS
jgi:sugar phosphate isomerase/epimerase